MAWDSRAAMLELVELLETIPGLEPQSGVHLVKVGEPKTIGSRVSAFVKVGALPWNDRQTSDLVRRNGELLVWFGYRVQDAPETAELELADIVDAFEELFLTDRKSGKLGGTVESMEMDTSAASAADYSQIGGQEFRLYPLVVRFVQSHTIP
jgi:hypothetical protein